MAQTYVPKDYIAYILPHTTYALDPTTSVPNDWVRIGTFFQLPFPTKERVTIERLRGNRQVDYRDQFISDYGVPQVIDIPEHDVTKENLNLWLMAFFQNVTDAGSSPYTHEFTFSAPDPDFAGGSGSLLSYLVKHPASGRSWMAASCIVTSLTIRVNTDTRHNRVLIHPVLMARKLYPLDTPVGSYTDPTEAFWTYNQLKSWAGSEFAVGSDTPELYDLEITMSNAGGGLGQDGDGRPTNYVCPDPIVEGTLKVLKRTADSDGWIADWEAGTQATIKAHWEQVDATDTDGDLKIIIPATFLEGVSPGQGPVKEQLYSFPFAGERNATYESAEITTVDTTATIASLFSES